MAEDAAVQSVGEQKLYTLPGKVDINVGENKQVPLLSAHDVPVDAEYYFSVSGDTDGGKQSVNLRLQRLQRSESEPGQAPARRHCAPLSGRLKR